MEAEPQSPMLRCCQHFPGERDSVGVADEFVRALQELRVILTPVLGVRGGDFADLMALQSSLAREDVRSSRASAGGVLYSFRHHG